MAVNQAATVTPAQFREQFNLSPDQFKRLKARVAEANPGAELTRRNGNAWEILDPSLFIAQLPPSAAPSESPSAAQCITSEMPGETSSALATYQQPSMCVVDAELVPDIQELQIVLPDHSTATAQAQLEIAHTAHVQSGNANMLRAQRQKALIEQAQREAVEDFALANKAYAATSAALQQQQLNAIGLGQSASPVAPTEPATEPTAKKPQ